MRPLLLLLALFSLGLLEACWDQTRPAVPEECKVTTNPEACRKYYEHR